MSLAEDVREQIRLALRVAGTSQAELARQIGISKKHVNQMLLGHAAISLDMTEAMLAVLGRTAAIQVGQRLHVIYCKGCGRAWADTGCTCTCSDPAGAHYEDWVTDPDPADIPVGAWRP